MIAQIVRHLRSPPTAWLIGASIAAFATLAIAARAAPAIQFCGDPLAVALLLATGSFTWALFDVAGSLYGWLLMFCAMMLPLVVLPVDHIARTTLRSRLPATIGAFLVGYMVAWLPIGLAVTLLAAAIRIVAGTAWGPAIAAIAAMVWSASPLAQMARNRAHRQPPLAIGKGEAERDCAIFGWRTGSWCALACWPWMVVGMPAGDSVLPMLAITGVLLAERAMPPGAPRWQLPRFAAFALALRPYPALLSARPERGGRAQPSRLKPHWLSRRVRDPRHGQPPGIVPTSSHAAIPGELSG